MVSSSACCTCARVCTYNSLLLVAGLYFMHQLSVTLHHMKNATALFSVTVLWKKNLLWPYQCKNACLIFVMYAFCAALLFNMTVHNCAMGNYPAVSQHSILSHMPTLRDQWSDLPTSLLITLNCSSWKVSSGISQGFSLYFPNRFDDVLHTTCLSTLRGKLYISFITSLALLAVLWWLV